MIVDYINERRCGVNVGGVQYSITLRSFEDSSSVERMEHLLEQQSLLDTDFFLGPYSSDLTEVLLKWLKTIRNYCSLAEQRRYRSFVRAIMCLVYCRQLPIT